MVSHLQQNFEAVYLNNLSELQTSSTIITKNTFSCNACKNCSQWHAAIDRTSRDVELTEYSCDLAQQLLCRPPLRGVDILFHCG